MPLVARVGDTWYESWINACADEGRGRDELDILATQNRLVFLIYDGTSLDPERTVQLANPLGRQQCRRSVRVLQRVAHAGAMDEFADAREELYAAYSYARKI